MTNRYRATVDYEAAARDETETEATLERLVPFEGAGLG
jgi:hypothetical protein